MNKSSISKNDILQTEGYATFNYMVELEVDESLRKEIDASSSGLWGFNLDVTYLEYGECRIGARMMGEINEGLIMFKYFTAIFILISALAFAESVSAASMYLVPEQGTFNHGEEFSVYVNIDSEGESINASEAKISWTGGVLEFVEIEKNGSVFNFWVEEPNFSAESNSISFIGGTIKSVSGGALQVFKIKFRGVNNGVAEVSTSDAVVTAADGKGTNVLLKVKGASFIIGTEAVKPDFPVVGLPSVGTSPQPERVLREAVPATKLPQKPVITVPLYPEEGEWNNRLGEVVALWDLPLDVIQVATRLSRAPDNLPGEKGSELFTGKSFGILEDGIWYIRVQFRNNIGWGPTTHYRIALDITPPLDFEVTASEGEISDNPAPVILFKTSDTLSGLSEYHIKIDDGELIKISAKEFDGNFTLPLLNPGAHKVVIKAWDLAGNSIADSIELEILPIPSPSITFVTKDLFSNEARGLTVKGIAFPDINVLLQIQQLLGTKKGEVIAKSVALTDERGNWEFTFDEPLRNGRYVVTAQSQDARGALSLVVESPVVVVKSKPIIQIGFFQLGKGGAILALLVILIIGFGGGIVFCKWRPTSNEGLKK